MKQKGQGIIEFALIVPLLVVVGVAVVYVGIMFLDYTQYSNAARDAARDISVQTDAWDNDENKTTASEFRKSIVNAINKGSGNDYETIISRYSTPYTNIFKAKWTAQFYYLDSNKILQKTSDATKADTIEVSITLIPADDVDLDPDKDYEHDLNKSWLSKLINLPPIRYKMILE